MSIEFRNVSKSYGDTPVVDRVSGLIQSGEFFVLLGPSGSGKSTLLRMIAGLEEVHTGSVHLFGKDVTHSSPKDRGLGFVFQSYVLFKHMTVAENVGFALKLRKQAAAQRRERCEELLEMVGLAGYGARYPRQLSGGQQQRVALARALAAEPRVLLLDEPFGALDAKIRTDLRHHLREIQRRLGLTTVFVTHDQEEAFELADRIAVMNRGRMLEVGHPRELYLWPRSQFVATFLGAANLLVGQSLPRSVRLGALELPLGSDTAGGRMPRRVQVLFRPEDVGLSRQEPAQPLAKALVVDRIFLGAYEHLRLSLPLLEDVRSVTPPIPFGSNRLLIDARRSQYEAAQMPLNLGDTVYVTLQRVHVLAPASLRLLIETGMSTEAKAAHKLGEALAKHLDAEVNLFGGMTELPLRTTLTHPVEEADAVDEGYDIAILALRPQTIQPQASVPLFHHHLLLVPGPCKIPQSFLICVAVGEPGKDDVRFAERFAWQLGASATVMTVLPPECEGQIPSHVELFLEAAVRALSQRGVTARSLVRFGQVVSELRATLEGGGYDLLVIGAPLNLPNSGRGPRSLVADLFQEPPACPILLIRHG